MHNFLDDCSLIKPEYKADLPSVEHQEAVSNAGEGMVEADIVS